MNKDSQLALLIVAAGISTSLLNIVSFWCVYYCYLKIDLLFYIISTIAAEIIKKKLFIFK